MKTCRRLPLVAALALGLCASSAFACYAVVVGKNASADGSVLLGHNEQNDGVRFLNFRRIPRLAYSDGARAAIRKARELTAQLERR